MRTRNRSIVPSMMIAMIGVWLPSPQVAADAQAPAAKPAPAPPRAAPAVKPMTNADVIKMVQGDLGDDLILMAIRKAPRTAFDLSADGLLDLKSKGVGNAILRQMLDPTVQVEVPRAPAAPAAPTAAKPAASSEAPAAAAAAKESSARPARAEQPAGPATPAGGATFSVARTYDSTFDTVLAYLKKQGQSVDTASRDTGEIVTARTIDGRGRTGRRIHIAITRDSASSTAVRVAVTLQTRKKAEADSWSDPAIDSRQSRLAADELRAILTT